MQAVEWQEGALILLDQRLLPGQIVYRECRTAQETADAIAAMVVRGAPAIGVAAAFGVVLAAAECARDRLNGEAFAERCAVIRGARPTAVNLMWAVDRMRAVADRHTHDVALVARLEQEALAIQREDVESCRAIGRHGNALIAPGDGILTHCNAGALATAGYGTALGVVRAAWEAGKSIHVYADETRPYLQGARLTATELHEDGIPVTLLCDNMAGWLMKTGSVQKVIVGADRIAANGDTANKVGTYSLGILAKPTAFRCWWPRHSPRWIFRCPMVRISPLRIARPTRCSTPWVCAPHRRASLPTTPPLMCCQPASSTPL